MIGQTTLNAAPFILISDGIAGRTGAWVEADGDRDGRHEQGDQENARENARHEQLADILLGDDRVDHQRYRWRDHDPERAAGGDRAGCQLVRIAISAHGRHRHFGHGRSRRERRAADGGKAGTGGDGRKGETAAKPAETGIGSVNKGRG